jgi:hypothetical protein
LGPAWRGLVLHEQPQILALGRPCGHWMQLYVKCVLVLQRLQGNY